MAKSCVSPWLQQRTQRHFIPKAEQKCAYQVNSERRYKAAVKAALTKGYLKTLDEQFILKLQRSSENEKAALEVQEVQRIDVRYGGVQALDQASLLACCKLRICNLRGCYVSNMVAFYGCKNLLKLDLANNQISQLPGSDFWSSLSALKVLYLSGNVLSMTEDLVRLGNCQSLIVLTLYDTPLALSHNYRHLAVHSIFSLKALDRHVVSDDEVMLDLRVPGIFRAKGDNMKLHLYSLKKQGISVKEEVRQVFALLLAVDRVLAKFSPVTILQRHIRGWLVRRYLLRTAGHRIREFIRKNKDGGFFRARDGPILSNQTSLSTSIINALRSPFFSVFPLRESYPLPPPSTPNSTHRHSHAPPSLDGPITTAGIVIDLTSKLRSIEEHANADQWDQVEVGSCAGVLSTRDRNWTMDERRQSEQREVQQSVSPRVLMKRQGQQVKQEEQEVNQEGRLEDDVIIKGKPACLIKDGIGCPNSGSKVDNESLSKQHKELKEIARAARSKSSKEGTCSSLMRAGKKEASDLMYRRVFNTLSLHHLEDVGKYYREERTRREQDERNHCVAQKLCERKERSDKVKEHRAKRRERVVEQAWDDCDLMAGHAEDAENEQKLLQDQTTHRRQQGHVHSERAKEHLDASERTVQKLSMLSKYTRNEEERTRKAAKLAVYLETVRQRRANWNKGKEERRKMEDSHKMKLLAELRLDKEAQNARVMQKRADRVMEGRTQVLKERARCTGRTAMEESRLALQYKCNYYPKPTT